MRRKASFSRFHFVACLAAVCIALASGSAPASNAPWKKSRFQYIALKKDLRELLREFAADEGIPVEIAEGIEGSVSGSFDLPPQATLDLLASSHGFSWHYDGTMLYVAPMKEARDDGLKLRSDAGDQLHIRLSRADASAEPDAERTDGGDEAAARWTIDSSDKTLSAALARWAAAAGWQLLWQLPVDVEIDANASISGTFAQAVETIARSMEQTGVPMKAIFYAGNKVLRIVAKDGL